MARPIRFLQLSTFYPPWSFGGDAVYLQRLSHALADDGHDVEVAHCLDAYHLLHPAAPDAAPIAHDRVRRHGLKSGAGWLSPFITHQTGRLGLKAGALDALAAGRPFDVIHFHNISLLGPEVLGLESPGRPLRLYTAHEYWLVCPTHVLWQYGRRVCERPHCLPCTLLARRPPQLWRHTGTLEAAGRHVDQFIAPSRFACDAHAARGFAPSMVPLPLFADRADAEWQRPGPRPHARPYCLFVGRLEAIKGLQAVIPLWDRLPDVDLLVAGTGEHEATLRDLAAPNPRIRFLGFVPPDRLGPLYAHAVACVIPSLTWETFGIIAIEAFMRKTPVIARSRGALTEIVQESGGGILFESDDELMAAVDDLSRSRRRRAELGERGYAAFVRLWSREAHLTKYYALLRETAERALGRVPWES